MQTPKSYSSREIICTTVADVRREEQALNRTNYRCDGTVERAKLAEEIRTRFARNLGFQEIVYLPAIALDDSTIEKDLVSLWVK